MGGEGKTNGYSRSFPIILNDLMRNQKFPGNSSKTFQFLRCPKETPTTVAIINLSLDQSRMYNNVLTSSTS